MKISDIDAVIAHMPVVRADNKAGRDAAPPYNTHENSKAHNTETSQAEITTPSTDRILLNKFEGANDAGQAIAQQIRAVNNTMDLIEKHVLEMKATLESVVKAYPPYPQGSAERVAALRQFVGLRKMIDQLTFPPPEDSPAKILADVSSSSDSGDWELAVGKSQSPMILRHQPLHTGAEGLDIPEVSTEASEESIQNALNRVIRSCQTIQQRRQGFIRDANRIIAAIS